MEVDHFCYFVVSLVREECQNLQAGFDVKGGCSSLGFGAHSEVGGFFYR